MSDEGEGGEEQRGKDYDNEMLLDVKDWAACVTVNEIWMMQAQHKGAAQYHCSVRMCKVWTIQSKGMKFTLVFNKRKSSL